MEAIGVEMTAAELRLDLYRYENLFASTVQTTANDIYDETEDVAIRETAIRWKINAIPDIQAAVFRLDPLSGLADAFGFTAPMEQFFAEGAGKGLFGEQQHIAVNASRFLMSEVRALAVRVVGQERLNEVGPRYAAWVQKYPIQNISFGRRSVTGDAASITAANWGSGGLESVGRIEDLVRDLSDRLTIYGHQLPELARWHSELLVMEVDENLIMPLWENVESLDATAQSLDAEIKGIRAFVDATPDLISDERALILATVQKDLETALVDVDRQRLETVAALSQERAAIMSDVDALRAVLVGDVERARVAATSELEALVDRQVQLIADETDGLVDRIFWRALIVVVIGLLGLALVLRFARRTA